MKDALQLISKRIKQRLKELDMSYADFAKALGLPKSTASNYIRGEHDIPSDLWPDVSRVLKEPVAWLIGAAEDSQTEVPEPHDWRDQIEKTLADQGMSPEQRLRVLRYIEFEKDHEPGSDS